jgi:hypothetical protein
MRTLLIGILFANLIGCCPIPPQAVSKACTSKGCFYRTAAGPPAGLKRASLKPNPAPDEKSNIVVEEKSPVGAETEPPQISQLDDKSDPVIKKAKVTIAAKMENPASVEFGEMKRADRKNADGKFIDSICGSVRGKTASGGETGDRPFLYLVQEEDAYVGGYFMATSPYHNICN